MDIDGLREKAYFLGWDREEARDGFPYENLMTFKSKSFAVGDKSSHYEIDLIDAEDKWIVRAWLLKDASKDERALLSEYEHPFEYQAVDEIISLMK